MDQIQGIQTYAGIVYLFIMFVFWLAAFVILYHLIRFGVGNEPKKVSAIFLGGSILISIITTLFFAQIIF